MKDSFVFYASFYESIKCLDPMDQLAVYNALADYAINGNMPELSGATKAVFLAVKPQIDANNARYENGKKGGRKPMVSENTETEKPMVSQNAENEKPMVSEKEEIEKPMVSENTETEKPNVNVNENVNVNDNKESVREKAAPAPRKKYGNYGWVLLTPDQYQKLVDDLGQSEVDRCVNYVDESAQQTGNKNKWRDWNLVIRKCSREKWGIKAPQKKNSFSNFSQREEIDWEAIALAQDRELAEREFEG